MSEQRIKEILQRGEQEARQLGHKYVAPEHLLLGIITEGDNSALHILTKMKANINELKFNVLEEIKAVYKQEEEQEQQDAFEKLKSRVRAPRRPDVDNLPVLDTTRRVLRVAPLEARALNTEDVRSEHVLLALMHCDNVIINKVFTKMNVTYEEALRNADGYQTPIDSSYIDNSDEDDDPFVNPSGQRKGQSKITAKPDNNTTDTPALDAFGTDLTKLAAEGMLDPVVGRTKEIERMVQILSRRKKNNPILIGEPGVGKSAIVEGLALRIVEKSVSRVLFDKRVVSLDLGSVVAGTKYRGQFEERMKSVLTELKQNPNIIIFIDEIHTLVGAGGASGSLDAANMLKPALARGEIQCIGATTLNEYRQYIEKDGALERRFQKILVEPTSVDETIAILQNIKDRYEKHHNVMFTDEAIEACVRLTNRYVTDRCFPDKAIDALDEAGSRVNIQNFNVPKEVTDMEEELHALEEQKQGAINNQNFELAASFRDKEKQVQMQIRDAKERWQIEVSKHREKVDENQVAEVVSMMTGIPVHRMQASETEKLLGLRDLLKSQVVGQDDAVEKVVRAIQRNRAGLKDPNRPIGTFIFMGPTGVGKTLLAQKIAEDLFDSKDAIIRVDMSEFMEKHNVARLVGAPPGYIGYEQGGQLTEKVRRKPYSVVLFDEIEKAHQEVFNILLQVLDEGRLADGQGRYIDFRNTVIIMTSNVGSRELKDFGRGLGFAQENRQSDEERSQSILQKALKKAFAPEFINRVDDIISFHELDQENILKIVDIELRRLITRIEELGFAVDFTDEAKKFLADKSYDSNFGARPLRRSIQKYVEDPLAEMLLEARLSGKKKIKIVPSKDGEKLDIK